MTMINNWNDKVEIGRNAKRKKQVWNVTSSDHEEWL